MIRTDKKKPDFHEEKRVVQETDFAQLAAAGSVRTYSIAAMQTASAMLCVE